MTESVTITLDWPPSILWPNNRAHRKRKAQAERAYRDSAHALAIANGLPRDRWECASIHYRFFVPDEHRRRDLDNMIAAMKHGRDGLIHAGVIADDDWRSLRLDGADAEVDKANPRVELVITRLEGKTVEVVEGKP